MAIDGPAGSGKSTTAQILARKLKFYYLDTGSMYRALTWKAINQNLDVANSNQMQKLALITKIDFKKYQGGNSIFLDGKNISNKISSAEVNRLVSILSKHKEVRQIMVKKQREFAKDKNIVIEGRDTTTVVFPKADLKVFLKAGLTERAKRKFKQLKQKVKTSLKEQARLIRLRDKLDRSRKTSPLKVSPEAIIIDTTNLTVTQQVDGILKIFKEKMTA
ncbi:MAG: cytidylate kinase [candidate division Zixibacteria bacterium RBG_16_40_9]|nr:MAG: cytidylate kinase [candidate division Zixibacteria bacterium RBG_16_40_9]